MKRYIGGVAALALLLTGCGSESAGTSAPATTAAAESAAPGPFEMTGEFALIGGATYSGEDRSNCYGEGGYADLKAGTQVTVYTKSGDVAGAGSLESPSWDFDRIKTCVFKWVAEDIPAGEGPYQYEVSHRGKLTITEKNARAGRAAGSIGSVPSP